MTGLSGSGLVLQLNGAGNLGVSASGFTFANGLTSGATYSVTVLTQPTNPSQSCAVSSGSGTIGTANATNVAISCTTNSFTVGGTVNVLSGAGLVLQNNGVDDLPINAGGAFTFSTPLLSGTSYNVTPLSQPLGQTCVVTNGSGTVGAGDVASVHIGCTFSLANLNDPLALQQWHLKNTGQAAFADFGGVPGVDINAEPIFNLGITGENVTVAVVDTGLEIAHEDLAANVIPGGSWNFNFPASGNSQTDPTNTVVTDGDHGTSVSGIIAMAMNNAKGGIGVAPRAKLKGFNFLSMTAPTEQAFIDSIGASGSSPNSSDVFIFNQSFGIDTTDDLPPNTADEDQYRAGVTALRGGKGALYVKAGGNGFVSYTDSFTSVAADCSAANGTQSFVGGTFVGLSCENANFEPENAIPYQIVVGAINASGVRATYSSAGSSIWVSAPGGELGENFALDPGLNSAVYSPAVVTTDQSGCVKGYSNKNANNFSSFNNGAAPDGDVLNAACNYTNRMNGTSAATPVTAGVIALVLEANPALTWRDVKHILASTARQVDPGRADILVALTGGNYTAEPAWMTNAAGFKFHNWYGFGMVDASAAVTSAKSYPLGQLGAFTDTGVISSGPIGVAIPDSSVAGASSVLNVPGTSPVHFVEAVQITVSVTHPFTGDLGIELISPSGMRSVLKNIRDGFAGSADLSDMQLLSNAFYGENPSALTGNWTLKIVDGSSANNSTVGHLTAWTLRIYGH